MAVIEKIPALNGIRALAVLLVVISHSGFGYIIPGGFGVTVFFFLSGFLITTLLLNEFRETQKISILHFFIRRILRLYPAFLVAIILAYSLAYFEIIGGKATLIGAFAQFFYFANYFNVFFDGVQYTPAGTSIYWSLAVEEHFYLIYPLICSFFLIKMDAKKLLIFLFSLILTVLFWRIYLQQGLDFKEGRILYATDTRIDSIVFGCLLALLKNPIGVMGKRELTLQDLFLIVFTLAGIAATFLIRDEIFRLTLRYSIQGLLLSVLFYYAIAFYEHRLFSFLNSNILNIIGIYSYSIYLFHFTVIEVVQTNLPQVSQKYILLPIVLIISTIMSALVFKFIESPLKIYRKKYR